ncbi:hypothetical protein ACFQMM_16970 [Saliphagus sp. GCM10025308]
MTNEANEAGVVPAVAMETVTASRRNSPTPRRASTSTPARTPRPRSSRRSGAA